MIQGLKYGVPLMALVACAPPSLAPEPVPQPEVVIGAATIQLYPDQPPVPLANCIASNSTSTERSVFAAAGQTSVTPKTLDLVRTIVARPLTQICLSSQGISPELLG